MFFLSFLYQEPDPDTRRVVSLLWPGYSICKIRKKERKKRLISYLFSEISRLIIYNWSILTNYNPNFLAMSAGMACLFTKIFIVL